MNPLYDDGSYLITLLRGIQRAYCQSRIRKCHLEVQTLIANFLHYSWFASLAAKGVQGTTKTLQKSFLWNRAMTPKQDTDVLDTSKVINASVTTGEISMDKIKNDYEGSFTLEFLEALYKTLLERPYVLMGIIILTAMITNTILWLFYRELSEAQIMFRVTLILFALLSITINKSWIDLYQHSYCAKFFRGEYDHDQRC